MGGERGSLDFKALKTQEMFLIEGINRFNPFSRQPGGIIGIEEVDVFFGVPVNGLEN
jgi:hypothetical protein